MSAVISSVVHRLWFMKTKTVTRGDIKVWASAVTVNETENDDGWIPFSCVSVIVSYSACQYLAYEQKQKHLSYSIYNKTKCALMKTHQSLCTENWSLQIKLDPPSNNQIISLQFNTVLWPSLNSRWQQEKGNLECERRFSFGLMKWLQDPDKRCKKNWMLNKWREKSSDDC